MSTKFRTAIFHPNPIMNNIIVHLRRLDHWRDGVGLTNSGYVYVQKYNDKLRHKLYDATYSERLTEDLGLECDVADCVCPHCQ